VKVQSKVGLKYDAWHKEVVSKFGNMLGAEMVDFHGQVSKVSNSDLPFYGRAYDSKDRPLCFAAAVASCFQCVILQVPHLIATKLFPRVRN